MSAGTFEKALRALLQSRPFKPFVVELLDGRRFWIDTPESVGFSGGAAAFIAADGSICFFNHEQVRTLGGDSTPSA